MKLLTVSRNDNDEIVIRIPKDHLVHLVKMYIEDEFPEEHIPLTNKTALFDDVYEELDKELDETGDTLVYRMINEAIGAAIENGSEAFDDWDEEAQPSASEGEMNSMPTDRRAEDK